MPDQHRKNSFSRFILSVAIAMLICTGFLFLARRTGRHEWFFPELLALFMGCTWMERCPWKIDRPRLWSSLVIGSLIGYGLSLLPQIGLLAQLCIAYFLAGYWQFLTGVSISPMFSACMLPLYLGQCSWIYPIAIAIQVLILCTIWTFFDRSSNKPAFPPFSYRLQNMYSFCLRHTAMTLCLGIAIWCARRIGPFCAVPPLIVVFSAFQGKASPGIKKMLLGFSLCAIAAGLGGGGHLLTEHTATSPIFLLPFLILTLALTCRQIGYYLPPCAAAMLLAFLIPANGALNYIWQLPLGAILFIAVARLTAKFSDQETPTANMTSLQENRTLPH